MAITRMKRGPPPGIDHTPLTPGTPAASSSSHSEAARKCAEPAVPYQKPGSTGRIGGAPTMMGSSR